jgi:hypothetical protein
MSEPPVGDGISAFAALGIPKFPCGANFFDLAT